MKHTFHTVPASRGYRIAFPSLQSSGYFTRGSLCYIGGRATVRGDSVAVVEQRELKRNEIGHFL